MSELHNALLRGPWSAAVQNALGVGGSGKGGVERYGETLTPVMDLWSLIEWRYLRRERTGQFGTTEGVGAGRSRLGIQNASLTDLVVLEWVQNRGVGGSFTPTFGQGLTVDSLEFIRPIDTRFFTPTAGGLTAQITHRQGAIGGSSTGFGAVFLAQGQAIQLDMVIGPGWQLSFEPSADATAISLTFRVRERAAGRGEL